MSELYGKINSLYNISVWILFLFVEGSHAWASLFCTWSFNKLGSIKYKCSGMKYAVHVNVYDYYFKKSLNEIAEIYDSRKI